MRPGSLLLPSIVMLALGLSGRTLAGDVSYRVIVNPKNHRGNVDREFLRNAFLKKEVTWSDGETLRPVDLSSSLAVRERFTREILRKTPEQLKTYWNQQIFSGKGVPPPEADSVADVIAYVLANPGAVGYVPADVDPRGARIVEVR